MGLWQRIKTGVARMAMWTVDKIGPTIADLTFFQSMRLRLEGIDISQPYSQHPWVYGSARAIAQSIASVPFRLFTGSVNEANAITSGPLFELFRDVNPFMSRFQLWEATILYLDLFGESYWVLEDLDENGIPKEIWPFGPDFIEPIVDEHKGHIIGFQTVTPIQSESVTFSLEEIIYFRHFNPHDWNRGLGVLEPLESTVQQDHLCDQFSEALFENGADPGGILLSEEELTTDDMRRIRTGWEDKHQGPRKAGRMAILQGGLKYEPIKISNREIQFIEQREWHRDMVLAAFKVPKAELSVYESLNFATARVADRGFWQKTLMPRIVYIEDVLRSEFFSRIPGNVIGAFDLGTVPALP